MKGRMIKRFSLFITFVAFFSFSAGCAVSPTRLEMDYGTSFKLSKFNQILNPEAAKNLEPTTGLDGKAAQATVEKYQKGFETPSPPPVYTISIGGISK